MSRTTAEALWVCPTCGRQFATPKQWHSCLATAVGAHFAGKAPWLRECFDALVAEIERWGPLRVDAVKTSINLAARAHFAGVAVQKEALAVGFVLARKVDDPRIARHEDLGGRWTGHRVRIAKPSDLDAQLLNWLKEAYALKS
jgi:hypothetical protein